MIELGKVQELVIIRTKEFGVYLFFSQRSRCRRELGSGTR